MKRNNASHLLICILLPVNIAIERTDYFFNIFIFSHAIYCKLKSYLFMELEILATRPLRAKRVILWNTSKSNNLPSDYYSDCLQLPILRSCSVGLYRLLFTL